MNVGQVGNVKHGDRWFAAEVLSLEGPGGRITVALWRTHVDRALGEKKSMGAFAVSAERFQPLADRFQPLGAR